MTDYDRARLFRVVLPRAVCGFFAERRCDTWTIVEAAPYLRSLPFFSRDARAFLAALRARGATIDRLGMGRTQPPPPSRR